MTEIMMPRLSDSMEEGTILSWLKRDGDEVRVGDELLEIETDKATMTYEADAAGILTIVAPEGSTLSVGAVIATVGATVVAPAAPLTPAPLQEPSAPAAGSGGAGRVTPLARRFADEHGIDLATVSGTGPRGRITRADVASVAGVSTQPSLHPASAAPVVLPKRAPSERDGTSDKSTIVELSRVQRVIARRMAEAKATIPEYQVQTEVVMDEAISLHARLKTLGDVVTPSLNDLIVKACALALKQHPRANGSYRDGHLELHPKVNVGIAVATEDALLVPTIWDADDRSLGHIAVESRRLSAQVRDGSISPSELSGGTFTVSNLGMFGMTAITPVINPPQAAILGVGETRHVAVIVDEQVVGRRLMTLTLSCDHRVLYGADAARFLSSIRANLEQPLRLSL